MFRFSLVFGVLYSLVGAFILWGLLVGFFVFSNLFNVHDPVLGPVYRPGSLDVRGEEGYSIFTLDRWGFNNPPMELPVDVLVLGDSHTEAVQVGRAENFVSQTASRLSGAEVPVRVYNGGHAGRGPSDYVGYSQGWLKRFQPRVKVIQVSIGDFGPEALDRHRDSYFRLGDGQWEVVVNPPKNPPLKSEISFSERMYGLFPYLNFLRAKSPVWMDEVSSGLRRSFLPQASAPKSEANLVPAAGAGLKAAVIHSLAQAFGAKTLVLFLRQTPKLDGHGGILTSDPAEDSLAQELRSLCQAEGLGFVDTESALANLVTQGHLPRGFGNTLPGTGHLNTWGHAAVAEVLAPAVLEALR